LIEALDQLRCGFQPKPDNRVDNPGENRFFEEDFVETPAAVVAGQRRRRPDPLRRHHVPHGSSRYGGRTDSRPEAIRIVTAGLRPGASVSDADKAYLGALGCRAHRDQPGRRAEAVDERSTTHAGPPTPPAKRRCSSRSTRPLRCWSRFHRRRRRQDRRPSSRRLGHFVNGRPAGRRAKRASSLAFRQRPFKLAQQRLLREGSERSRNR